MRTLIPLQAALLMTLAAACGPQEFDLLLYGVDGDNLVFRCPGGEELTLPTYNLPNPTLGGQATACLGISNGTCPSTEGSGGVTAGDTQCLAPSFNPLLGTCVEDFFACFQPRGACQASSEGVARWDNGYRVESELYSQNEGAYFTPEAEEACLQFTDVTQFDLLPGTGTEIQVMKPR
ncbi:MAG: hypothetical protein KC933_06685 [Myxococcales bacterium]|nr:hypothetical protein [Myxococcales bacterium]